MKYKCLIVDDEPLARQVLKGYIDLMDSLQLVKECANSFEAASYLHKNNVDIMFLDIKMPGLTGMEFLRTIAQPPKVIITTAFSEYALEGYEYSVSDYLLKPYSFERFLKGVNKAIDSKQLSLNRKEPQNYIFLKTDKAELKLELKDILYFEAYGNFVKVHTKEKTHLVSQTMKSIEANIPGENFIRVHKSFIVSFNKIKKLEGNKIKLNDFAIPVGKHYKLNLEEALKRYRI